MLFEKLDDDQLLDLYRSLPPGSDLLNDIHIEIVSRGETAWQRIDGMFFQNDRYPQYQGLERRSDVRLRCA